MRRSCRCRTRIGDAASRRRLVDDAGALGASTHDARSRTQHLYSMPVPTIGASRHQQRHGLTLHVRAHQGAVRVVVFQEGDHRGRDGDDHACGRDVDVVDALARRLRVISSRLRHGDALVDEAAVLIERLVGLRDDVLVLLVGGHVVNLVGDACRSPCRPCGTALR